MRIEDVSQIVNELYAAITGNDDIQQVDATNIVDIGKALQGVTSVDNLYGKIVDKVGRTVILNKTFRAKFPSLYRDGWTFGSIMETLRIKPFVAEKDNSQNPTAGTYDTFLQYAPAELVAKYYNSEVNFRYKYWRPTDQLWTSFQNMETLVRFFSAIEMAVANSLEVDLLGLAQTALNNMAAQTIYNAYGKDMTKIGTKSTSKAVNVLFEYNTEHPTATLTVDNFRQSPEFWRFFVKKVKKDRERIQLMTKIYNIDAEDTHTNAEDIVLTVLSQFEADIQVDMQSDVYNKSLVDLPGNYETVAAWQATGEDEFSEAVASEISVKIEDGNTTADVEVPHILAYQLDKMAAGIACERKKATSFYNPDIDMTCILDNYRGMYYNDFSQNFIVYFCADET